MAPFQIVVPRLQQTAKEAEAEARAKRIESALRAMNQLKLSHGKMQLSLESVTLKINGSSAITIPFNKASDRLKDLRDENNRLMKIWLDAEASLAKWKATNIQGPISRLQSAPMTIQILNTAVQVLGAPNAIVALKNDPRTIKLLQQQELLDSEQRCRDVQTEMSKEKTRYEELIEDLKERKRIMIQACQKNNSRGNAMQSQLLQAKIELKQARNGVEEAEEDALYMRGCIVDVEREKQLLRDERDSLIQSLTQLTEEGMEVISKLRINRGNLELQREELTERNDQLARENEQLKAENEALKAGHEALKAEKEELRAGQEELERQREELRRRLTDSMNERGNLSATIDKLHQNLAVATRQDRKNITKRESVETLNLQHTNTISSLRLTISKWDRELVSSKTLIDELENFVAYLRASLELISPVLSYHNQLEVRVARKVKELANIRESTNAELALLRQTNKTAALTIVATLSSALTGMVPSMTVPIAAEIVTWMTSLSVPVARTKTVVRPWKFSLVGENKSPVKTNIRLRLAVFELHSQNTAKVYDQRSFVLLTRISQGLGSSDDPNVPFFVLKTIKAYAKSNPTNSVPAAMCSLCIYHLLIQLCEIFPGISSEDQRYGILQFLSTHIDNVGDIFDVPLPLPFDSFVTITNSLQFENGCWRSSKGSPWILVVTDHQIQLVPKSVVRYSDAGENLHVRFAYFEFVLEGRDRNDWTRDNLVDLAKRPTYMTSMLKADVKGKDIFEGL